MRIRAIREIIAIGPNSRIEMKAGQVAVVKDDYAEGLVAQGLAEEVDEDNRRQRREADETPKDDEAVEVEEVEDDDDEEEPPKPRPARKPRKKKS